MILTDVADKSQIYVLDDGSEVEIIIIEHEGSKAKVVVRNDEKISVTHTVIV